jgi:hypothetical protein
MPCSARPDVSRTLSTNTTTLKPPHKDFEGQAMTEEQRFMARFEQERSNGLVDMKFMVRDGDSLTREEFFGAVNRIDDAIAAGQCTHREKFEDISPHPSELLYA